MWLHIETSSLLFVVSLFWLYLAFFPRNNNLIVMKIAHVGFLIYYCQNFFFLLSHASIFCSKFWIRRWQNYFFFFFYYCISKLVVPNFGFNKAETIVGCLIRFLVQILDLKIPKKLFAVHFVICIWKCFCSCWNNKIYLKFYCRYDLKLNVY